MQLHNAQRRALPETPTMARMKRRVTEHRDELIARITGLSDDSLLVEIDKIRVEALHHLARKTAEAVISNSMTYLEEVLEQTWRDNLLVAADVMDRLFVEASKRALDTETLFGDYKDLQVDLEHQYLAKAFVAPA